MTPRNILLGITGGIAAYKAPDLVRRLRERGAEVQVVMTAGAGHFVTVTALQAVSGRPVRDSLWDAEAEAAMSHIELARWAELVLVAPATAEFLARLATGSAPDLLGTLCLATEAPIVVVPAMNRVMWANPAVAANRELVESRGVRVLGPDTGDQACGESGPGRMLEPGDIADAVLPVDNGHPSEAAADTPPARRPGPDGPLAGKTVLITAGPTREAIDAVRYISNRSSGKMGYAMAAAAVDAGARVVLVSGPTALPVPDGAEHVAVESAEQMFAAVHARIDETDVFIGAAAVADYRPREAAAGKIKKSSAALQIDLVRAPDILASVARLENGPFTVGFAAETERLEQYARAKLDAKQVDLIIANLVGDGRGFETDDNAAHAYWRTGEREFALAPKRELASSLVDLVAERYAAAYGSDTATELPVIAAAD